jgi:biotin synthase
VVYETGNRTVDEAVRRIHDGESLDRRDGLALIASSTVRFPVS